MKRISMTLIFTGLVFASVYSQQEVAQGAFGFWLTVAPTEPDDRDTITVTIAHEFGTSCFSVCDGIGEWITPTEYHIDWYILDTSGGGGGCLPIILTKSSAFTLEPLTSGDYIVTGTMYVAPWDVACTEGTEFEQVDTTFQVTPNVPAVSQWGLVVLVLLLMIAGTICLHKRVKVFFLSCFFIIIPCTTFAQQPDLNAPHHPERLLVRFKDKVSIAQKKAVHARSGAVHLKSFRHVKGLTLVKVPAARLQAALKAYQKNPNVLYAEPDYKVYLTNIPNDTHFADGSLWGMHNTGQVVNGVTGVVDADIDAPEAWDVWTGDPDFRIAVVDTGVNYLHNDLVNNIWTNPVEEIGDKNGDGCPGVCGVDDDGDGLIDEDSVKNEPGATGYSNDLVDDDDENGYNDDIHGYNFVDSYLPSVDPMDDSISIDPVDGSVTPIYHGTHVAGTIGAVGNNAIGVAGVNWQCKIVALKIFPAVGEESTVSDACAAMEYIIDNDIIVSNHSYNYFIFSQAHYDVIKKSQKIGHIFIAASGNCPPGTCLNNNDSVNVYPPNYDLSNIIAVTATDNKDEIPWWAHYGATTVDLGAPGVYINSTSNDNLYRNYQGTSMAAPHVTGVVALVMSKNPNWYWQTVINRIFQTVRPVASLDPNGPTPTVTGGVVNAAAPLSDCNGNGIDDACDIDCGNPNGPCDVPGCGSSADCNNNAVPDDCDRQDDCNNNGILDICDLYVGSSLDCDENAVPDECDPNEDCNNNGIQDICDIASGYSVDCNENSIPDLCELDSCGESDPNAGDCCSANGSPGCDCNACYDFFCALGSACCGTGNWSSSCAEIATAFPACNCDPPGWSGLLNDCNSNGVLDECDVAMNTSQDVIGINAEPDSVPDECQPDCQDNKLPDSFEIAFLNLPDCNLNTIPDECEPQEDCNENGTQDICDIANGTSEDCDGNLVPDECENHGPTGACCTLDINAPCDSAVTECSCTYHGGIFQGASSFCGGAGPKGACCLPGDECQPNTYKCTCLAQGGTFAGDGSGCFFFTCLQFGPQGP